MERSIFFFLKSHISAPSERNCPNFFLSDPGVPGPIYGSESLQLSHLFADLTDVTLADEDTNPILTDNAHRTFQGNVAISAGNL